MEELNILHTMDAPIVVFTAGVMEDPHRSVTVWLLPFLHGRKAYVLQKLPYAARFLLLNSMLSIEINRPTHRCDTLAVLGAYVTPTDVSFRTLSAQS